VKHLQFRTESTVKSEVGPHHLHSLDIARGVAALAVVLWHWQHFFFVGTQLSAEFRPSRLPLYGALRVFYEHGSLAVSLFFSLSGFVFFWLYADDIAKGTLSLRRFFLQRLSRLYPLHLATLLIVAAIQPLYHSLTDAAYVYLHNDIHHFVLNALMLSMLGQDNGMSFNGPSWSVSVEMLLYAIFFLFCSAVRPRLATIVGMALTGVFAVGYFRPTIGRSVGSFFLGGCVTIAYAYLSGHASRGVVTKGIVVSVSLMWLLLLIRVSLPDAIPLLSSIDSAGETIMFIAFPLTILALTLAESMHPDAFRRLASATRLGPLSYSVYLIHFPLQLLIALVVTKLSIPADVFYSPLALLAFLALLVGLGLLSHYRFEMPVQRWLRKRDRAARSV
jgi:peptidoglycan/LPS O-acetylase OafA/YrhL